MKIIRPVLYVIIGGVITFAACLLRWNRYNDVHEAFHLQEHDMQAQRKQKLCHALVNILPTLPLYGNTHNMNTSGRTTTGGEHYTITYPENLSGYTASQYNKLHFENDFLSLGFKNDYAQDSETVIQISYTNTGIDSVAADIQAVGQGDNCAIESQEDPNGGNRRGRQTIRYDIANPRDPQSNTIARRNTYILIGTSGGTLVVSITDLPDMPENLLENIISSITPIQ